MMTRSEKCRQSALRLWATPDHRQKMSLVYRGRKFREACATKRDFSFIKNISSEDLAYIAGFLDGEGSISAFHMHDSISYKIVISIANTNLPVLQWMKDKIGGFIYIKKQRGNQRQSYRLMLSQNNAGNLLEALLPYLKIKLPQAEVALSIWGKKYTDADVSPEVSILRELNARGVRLEMRA